MIDKNVLDKMLTEDNEMLLRIFVHDVGYDYRSKDPHDPSIHPRFSEETIEIWKEIKKRMKEPVTKEFDSVACVEELQKEYVRQIRILEQSVNDSSSYHYGLKQGFGKAIDIVKSHISRKD